MKHLLLIIFFSSTCLFGKEVPNKDQHFDYSGKRERKYHYSFVEQSHTSFEKFGDGLFIFSAATVLYPLTQPEIVDGTAGSWRQYKNNFGKITFDQDEPFWNFIVHPFSGSQMYLYYRARGYSEMEALTMNFISSALFEFTIEIYSEPASVQDLFNTPMLGSIFGLGIEKFSFYLLNSGSILGKVLGHAINPSTLFWFYDGKVILTPHISPKKGGKNGLSLMVEF